MSTKMSWTRLFADKWILDLTYLSPIESNVYIRLQLEMLRTSEPLLNNMKVLARYTGCTVKTFVKALDVLLSIGHVTRLEDGRLWSQQVEEELNDSKENLNKFSERASKAAQARWDKQKKLDNSSNNVKHNASDISSIIKHDANDMLVDAINNNNNIYNKKTNTIVLSKKENALEDLATEVSVQSETTDDAVEQQLDHDAPSSENQSPVSQQKSTEKKTKRSGDKRGCRIPEDFEPNLKYAIDKGLTHDEALSEFERFKNFWIAKTGKDATKTDWQLTWYNWVTSDYGTLAKKKAKLEKEKRNGVYGNYPQREKSIGERIADNIRNLNSRGFFKANLQNDSAGIPITLESWELIDETARNDSVESL
ncbi:DUF1376 domain-containing protein [Bartonella schoenbuchensis]|uniref:Phage related protein n=2 Tax=Bartonella schoenbuchensis TaxID=165694 RepID=A0A1S6XQI1_BARSR|nr:DUF1376 domain-containing protein [Bartonella schoenbuchensis]AQX30623.1 Protein of unknown function (DUF1376) [Bartonella schoenbuchensis R1]CDP80281.1 phage related protein [Bartonella schoenbuchensis]